MILYHIVAVYWERNNSGCNIGCKTLFASKLPLKLTLPAGTSTGPATLLNNGKIGLSPKHYLQSGASQGLIELAPLQFLAEFTCNLQRGKWLCFTLILYRNDMSIFIVLYHIVAVYLQRNMNMI